MVGRATSFWRRAQERPDIKREYGVNSTHRANGRDYAVNQGDLAIRVDWRRQGSASQRADVRREFASTSSEVLHKAADRVGVGRGSSSADQYSEHWDGADARVCSMWP